MTRHRKKGLIHAVADCKTCGKHWSNYKTARKQAREHSKKTGHETHGEEAICFSYGGY